MAREARNFSMSPSTLYNKRKQRDKVIGMDVQDTNLQYQCHTHRFTNQKDTPTLPRRMVWDASRFSALSNVKGCEKIYPTYSTLRKAS